MPNRPPIIIIIMNGSCIAQNLFVAKTHCANTRSQTWQTIWNITNKYNRTMDLRQRKSKLEEVSFQLGLKLRESREISKTDRQRVPNWRCNEAKWAFTNSFQVTLRSLQTFLTGGPQRTWRLVCAEWSRKVSRESPVEVTVCQSCHLVLASKLYRQPVEFFQHGCHVVAFTLL